MEKYKCAIIDDEFLARKLLKDYVSKLPHLDLIGDFDSPLEALEMIQNNSVDILFLDIQMPELTGIEFLKNMQRPCAVIFTTAYSEYALEGYELNVVEYLLKPFSFSRFLQAVNKATELVQMRRMAYNNNQQSQNTIEKNPLDGHIVVRTGKKLVKVLYKDIMFIEGALEYVTFYTAEKKIMGLYSLKELEKMLPENGFFRSHKSYIIGLNHIQEIEGNEIHIREYNIPLSKSHRTDLLEKLAW